MITENNMIDTSALKKIKYLKEFMAMITMDEKKFLLRNDLLTAFTKFRASKKPALTDEKVSDLYNFLMKVQELFIINDYAYLVHRYSQGKWSLYSLRTDCGGAELITVREYLDHKDFWTENRYPDNSHLRLDFMPFYDYAPVIKDTLKTGNGIRFLNRYLSNSLFSNPNDWNEKLFNFIKLHKYNGQQLLASGSIHRDARVFYESVEKAAAWLSKEKKDTPFSDVESRLRKEGFEPGWGDTAGRIRTNMGLLLDLINEPDDTLLSSFISAVALPLISKIAIVSPHGWFAQEGVLGKPDTGGQVIYILDQVRALEKYITAKNLSCGLDIKPQIIVLTRLIPEADGTTCWMRKEKIHGTENSYILRVPFTETDHSITRHWISRFHVWPYLERFTDYAERELTGEFQGRPDLIIGNYSDGNMVASLLSDRMDVIHCTIAHALEKTKYLFSDMYWADMKERYNFDLQITADLYTMNRSDFIITSSQQEISGTEYSMGQYESYQFFTLPGLYQTVNGISLFAPRFNIIPPGVDEDIYFPYYETERRTDEKTSYWTERLFTITGNDIAGTLNDPEKPPLFTMARLDRIKNITGLAEAFGMSDVLRKKFNLIIAAGVTSPDLSGDNEEKEEINRLYSIIDRYNLHGSIRWLPSVNKMDTGEVYRIIADRKGIFVQPALFEAFGLTILEAMLSGLPVAGTKFGGPLEIIEEGISGAHINTSSPDLMAHDLEKFADELFDGGRWTEISGNSIKRVNEKYTWKLYSEKLISLASIYGFWRYSISGKGRQKMNLYTDLIYNFLFKQRL